MNRLAKLAGLARLAPSLSSSLAQSQGSAWNALKSWSSRFATAAGEVDVLEHATGAERYEGEQLAKGVDPWREAWLDAPFGTEDNPVVVPSAYSERVVGVPDPDDDSLVWWGVIEEGQAPKQIIEGGEFFVLKKIAESGGHH
ncbi:hypothetical protein N2152v2_002642 [Parachlorella kessleri]